MNIGEVRALETSISLPVNNGWRGHGWIQSSGSVKEVRAVCIALWRSAQGWVGGKKKCPVQIRTVV